MFRRIQIIWLFLFISSVQSISSEPPAVSFSSLQYTVKTAADVHYWSNPSVFPTWTARRELQCAVPISWLAICLFHTDRRVLFLAADKLLWVTYDLVKMWKMSLYSKIRRNTSFLLGIVTKIGHQSRHPPCIDIRELQWIILKSDHTAAN